jgi:hypothetical protein
VTDEVDGVLPTLLGAEHQRAVRGVDQGVDVAAS